MFNVVIFRMILGTLNFSKHRPIDNFSSNDVTFLLVTIVFLPPTFASIVLYVETLSSRLF